MKRNTSDEEVRESSVDNNQKLSKGKSDEGSREESSSQSASASEEKSERGDQPMPPTDA